MAKQRVDLRLDSELLAWADEYAKSRGLTRTELLEQGLRAFREDCERGVPEFRERVARVTAVRPLGPKPTREDFARSTMERSEFFSRLRQPDSVKGVRKRDQKPSAA